MTFHEAACKILKEEKAPLISKEIATRILKQGLVHSNAKNPNYSIAQTIEKNIRDCRYLEPSLVFLYEFNKRKIWFKSEDNLSFDRENNISINKIPDELMKMIDYETEENNSKSENEILVGIMKRGLQEIIIERKQNLECQLNQINAIL